MKKNIIEKIWETHIVEEQPGYPAIFAIDLHLIHEVTSPQAFQVLRERGLEVFEKGQTVATVDHNVSTSADRLSLPNPISRNQINAIRKNTEDFRVPLFDMASGRQGIVHVIGPELGLVQPGLTIVCGDSHTSTHGAFGALAFGVGTSEVGHVLATGCLLQKRPKTMKVEFVGSLGRGVTSKELILRLINEVGVRGGTAYVIEFCGEVIRQLSMEERMTICNMSIECGARAGLISPDDITFAYLKGREAVSKREEWGVLLKHWQSFASDQGATYDKEITINIEGMAPIVTWGTNPGQSIPVDGVIPDPGNMDSDEAAATQQALEYVKLEGGRPIEGTPIQHVFLGSCTNARISDFRAAASILRGKKVAKGVKVFLVPGSEMVRKEIAEEGLDTVFQDAGVDVRQPGCSACLGMNEDKIPSGERCASTSNRNFMGRQGPGAITHLMSPIMAATAAVTGKITDVREYLEEESKHEVC